MFHTTQMALMRTAEIAMPKQHSSGASGNILSGRKCVKTFSLCTIFLPHWYLFQPQRDLSDKKTDQPFLGLTCEPSSNYQPCQSHMANWAWIWKKDLWQPAAFSTHQLFCHCDSARITSHSTVVQKGKWEFWDMIWFLAQIHTLVIISRIG